MERRGFAIILGVILWSASSPAHAQTLPEGPGKSLVSTQCANCHALDVALSKRGDVAEWSAILKTMIERGAPIGDADAAIIAAYLGQNFGPGAPAPVAAARVGQQVSALPDLPGRDVVTKKCAQCHQMSMWTALRQDHKAWESTVYRMIGRGALWTEDDVRAMADYLAQARGPLDSARGTPQ